MEVPNGGLGDLGDLPPIDVGDAPRPVGTTSVRFLPVAVPGAGCIADSGPRRGAGEGCCEDNSGTEGALGEEEGDGRMAEWMERVEAVGQKKGAKVGWTPGERVLLWECYIRTGGVNTLHQEDNRPIQPGRCRNSSKRAQCMVPAQRNWQWVVVEDGKGEVGDGRGG